jgi:uncharacterized membrane protein YozB (DUF420 family)
MPDLSFLPAVNASLNAVAGVLLIVALVLVKRKRIEAHKRVMLSAFAVSSVFLVLYLLHKAWRGTQEGDIHTAYHGEGFARGAYLFILLTHVVLAVTVPVFAIVLIRLGLRRRDDLHRRIARWAWPIWMYVSVTGVVIYFMLYHFNPQS